MAKNKTKITVEPGKQEIWIEREFDAPREVVFKAFTDPKLITQWWGPRYLTTKIDKMDIRSGRRWRFIQTDKQGNSFGFHGVVHDVTTPSRIIQTFEFEGLPESGHVLMETATFEELPGKRTKYKGQSVFQSVTDRDGMVQSGMEGGLKESHDRLDELLARHP